MRSIIAVGPFLFKPRRGSQAASAGISTRNLPGHRVPKDLEILACPVRLGVVNTTSFSLLVRVRDLNDQLAWSRFVRLYSPLIYRWGKSVGLGSDDAADLVQEVMALLIRKLPAFRYDQTKSFRSWLKTITINRWREKARRKRIPVAELSSQHLKRLPEQHPSTEFWEGAYQRNVIQQAAFLLQAEFEAKTWEACRRYVFDGESPAALANELDMSVWTIYSAKSRLIRRLRDELDGLLD